MFCIFLFVTWPPLSKPNWNKHLIEKAMITTVTKWYPGKRWWKHRLYFQPMEFPWCNTGQISAWSTLKCKYLSLSVKHLHKVLSRLG